MHLKKQQKVCLYLNGYFNIIFRTYKNYDKKKHELFSKLKDEEIEMCYERKNYYNKGNFSFKNISTESTIEELRKNVKTPKSYYFDFFHYARYFNKDFPIRYIFGDVNFMPKEPSIVKSRPITNGEQTGILLNLDRQRHFIFVKDDISYGEKKNILFGRLNVFQEHRIDFFRKHFITQNVDIGQVKPRGENKNWRKQKVSIKKHLQNKFILSLEGNDVATNLKWVMSSNSIAVSPKLKFETWFMEGLLRPDEHYIEIASDYSDLEEKLDYFFHNPKHALEIIHNANRHVSKFQNKHIEELTSLLVLESLFLI